MTYEEFCKSTARALNIDPIMEVHDEFIVYQGENEIKFINNDDVFIMIFDYEPNKLHSRSFSVNCQDGVYSTSTFKEFPHDESKVIDEDYKSGDVFFYVGNDLEDAIKRGMEGVAPNKGEETPLIELGLSTEEMNLINRCIDTRLTRLLEVKKVLNAVNRDDPSLMEEYYKLCDLSRKFTINEK